MRKKILLLGGALLVVVTGVAALSAYEAHVINVTAHIENALSVDPQEIAFGTVFPQEYLERGFTISLSDSFMTEDRVDDVEYNIVQKPKCWNEDPENPEYTPVDYATHACPQGFVPMLDLCEYLSKLPEEEPGDIGEPSYYDSDNNTCPVGELAVAQLAEASGRLSKEAGDISDTWTVDLKVPPVEGYVGQDWPAGCPVVSQNDKDYGCDLWIEVTNISLPSNGICEAKPDVMQVLDESGSIDAGELFVLKTAAKAFITALAPAADGAHMGQTSFETTGSLDHHLSYNVTTLNAAVDGLGSAGYTNLKEGIEFANTELADPTYDRNDVESPDFMVIITDGNPNRPIGTPEQDAIDAATAAKNAGVTIYVVGVGGDVNSDWLKNNIASSPAHYYDAANFAALQAILEAIASCQP